MHPHLPTDARHRTGTPRGTRRRATFGLAATAALLFAIPAIAQGDADPSDVVVASLGDTTVTLEAFELRFEAAVRSTLAQQGVEPDAESATSFAAQRPGFLEQLGQELVLSAHADDLGIAAADAEVDAVVDQARAEYGGELADALAAIGFASTEDFEAAVRRSLNAQRVVETLRAEARIAELVAASAVELHPDRI